MAKQGPVQFGGVKQTNQPTIHLEYSIVQALCKEQHLEIEIAPSSIQNRKMLHHPPHPPERKMGHRGRFPHPFGEQKSLSPSLYCARSLGLSQHCLSMVENARRHSRSGQRGISRGRKLPRCADIFQEIRSSENQNSLLWVGMPNSNQSYP